MTPSASLTAEYVESSWEVLLAAIHELPATKTFADIMSVVCRGARKLSNADGITFVRREGDLCHYMDEDAIGPLWKGKRFPMTACISGLCMLHRYTAVIPDIYACPWIPHDAYRPTFVQTLVMVPVGTEDPIAAIGAYWAKQHVPTPHTVRMFEALARSTARVVARTVW